MPSPCIASRWRPSASADELICSVDPDLADVVRHYLGAALWNAPEYESGLSPASQHKAWSPDTVRQVIADCSVFMRGQANDLCDMPLEDIGNDFLLTRSGAGVGFWSRNLGERGIRLTIAARDFTPTTLVIGDDALTYLE